MSSVKARVDERGRLQLPAALRRRLGVKPGGEVLITPETDGARIISMESAARGLIGLAGQLDHSVLEDLRDIRQQDATDEDEGSVRSP